MKSSILVTILALLLPGTISTTTAQEIAEPLTTAVLHFDASDEKLKDRAAEAAVLLSAELSTKSDLWIVERAEIDAILGEQTMSLSGLTDPGRLVQAGKILGAEVLITGRLIAGREQNVLVAKVMSSTTSRVFGETVTVPREGELTEAAAALAEKIEKLLSTRVALFRPPVETPEARMARLAAQLGDQPRPSILIKIEERDLRAPTPDPAVETEFQKTLLALGFDVLEEGDRRLPDLTITGEAFSQTGARRGQLVSARARTEIKVVRRNDGKLLVSDRETTSAVDTSEAVAGKSALQRSADILIERILQKLTVQ